MNKRCPIYQVAGFIGKKWTLLLLVELYKGKTKWKRYSRLKSSLMNITPKILSARLRELEKQGLVKKRVSAKTFPVKSQYRLTGMGEDFMKIIHGMKRWGLRWKVRNEHCENVNCRDCEL